MDYGLVDFGERKSKLKKRWIVLGIFVLVVLAILSCK
jgi:hypothetical protein